MADTQWLRIHSFLNTCSVLYVGKEARVRFFRGNAVLDGADGCSSPWHQLPAAITARPTDQSIWPRRLAYLHRICPPCGWTARTGAAAGASKKKRRSPLSAAVGGTSAPRSPSWRIARAVPARDGRPAPRPPPSPGLGGYLDGRAAVLSDHGLGLGRVEAVFQPDPADYHTTDIVFIDGPGRPRGCHWQNRSTRPV